MLLISWLRSENTCGVDWEALSIEFGNGAAGLESLSGANVEDERNNVQLAPETSAEVWRELYKARGYTSTNKLHEMF